MACKCTFNKQLLKPLLMELLGTFLIAYVYATSGNGGIAFGAVIAMVYLGYHISFACYDPAVTLAVVLNGGLTHAEGKAKWLLLGFYAAAQMLGGLLGAFFGYLSLPDNGQLFCLEPDDAKYNVIENLVATIVVAMFVSYVVLATAFTKEKEGNQYYGWCIGASVLMATLWAPVVGGSVNPAIMVGQLISTSIVKPSGNSCASDNWKHVWWMAAGPFIGALAGYGLHRLANGSQYGDAKTTKFAPYIQELLGTFFFVFAYGASIMANGSGSLAPYVFGVLVYCGGHISGGQYNPAVTLAAFVRGAQNLKKSLIFVGMQFLGAIIGAVVVYLLTRYGEDSSLATPSVAHPARAGSTDVLAGWLAEFVLTFIIVMAVLVATMWDKFAANALFGIIIAMAYGAAASSVGAATTSSVGNPALWFGTNLMYAIYDSFGSDFGDIWLFWTAECLAAVAATFTFMFLADESRGKSNAVLPA